MSVLHQASTAVLILISAGVLLRKHRRPHIAVMALAFAVDLGLVLYIEATRHAVVAVAKASAGLLWFHAGVSLAVLALYLVQIGLARSIIHGAGDRRRLHAMAGAAFVTLRLLSYGTSFFVTAQSAPVSAELARR